MLTTCMTFIFLCWNFWRPHFTLTKFELTKKNVQNFAETESTKLTRSRRSNGRCWKWSNSQEHYETISRLSFWLKLLIDLILSTKFLWKGTKTFEDLLFYASDFLFASIVKLSLKTKQFKRKKCEFAKMNSKILKWGVGKFYALNYCELFGHKFLGSGPHTKSYYGWKMWHDFRRHFRGNALRDPWNKRHFATCFTISFSKAVFITFERATSWIYLKLVQCLVILNL